MPGRKKKRSSPAISDDADDAEHLTSFRARLAAGDYDGVLGSALGRTLRGAASDTGLEAEVGALRLAMIRLLQEEQDPSRLAAGVSRVAGVAVQAARLRQGGDGELDELRELLRHEVEAIEREAAASAQRDQEESGNGTIRRSARPGGADVDDRAGTGTGIGAGEHQFGAELGLRGGDPADGPRPD